MPSLPLICHPYLEETFGSWLHRCADSYCTTTGKFADSVLAMTGEPAITAQVDWDTAPPPQLLRAFSKVSPFTQSELEYLVAPRRRRRSRLASAMPIARRVSSRIRIEVRRISDGLGSTRGRSIALRTAACWAVTVPMSISDRTGRRCDFLVGLRQHRVPLAEQPNGRSYGLFSFPRCMAAAANITLGPAISISHGLTFECSRNTLAGICSRSLDRRKPIVSFQSSSASLARFRTHGIAAMERHSGGRASRTPSPALMLA